MGRLQQYQSALKTYKGFLESSDWPGNGLLKQQGAAHVRYLGTAKMSVVGIDLGNLNSVIAVARNRGVDVICNEVSNRMTPSLVSFGAKNRFLGESAKTQEVSNFRNTVASLKRILGKRLEEIEATEVKFINCELCEKDGEVAARVNYCGEEQVFSATELMAMFLGKLREITHAEVKNAAMDVVLSVPVYYTDRQRRALIDAAEMAQVRCIRLINETTASALAWGMPKFDLPEDQAKHVCFIDIGQSSYTATIVAFKKGQLEVKGVGFDADFGGRCFDDLLAEHFCNEFAEKRKLDLRSNKKAMFRLRSGCERVKKILSANAVTSLHVENIMNDIDVTADISRTTFESMCGSLLERIPGPIQRALEMARIAAHEIDVVELVGGSTRIPAIKERLLCIFGKELSTTMNQDEAVSRGCALQCALQSPVFKVREFSIQEVTTESVKFTWEPTADAPEDVEYEVFPAPHHLPSTKMLSFKRNLPFNIQAVYSGNSQVFSTYTIEAPTEAFDLSTMTIKVKTRVNPSGVFGVEGATIVDDADANRKINCQVTAVNGSLPKGQLQAKIEAEANMTSSDKLVADTADSKNALEEYIYDIRGKVCGGSFERFASESEREKLGKKVAETEEWLYGESGEEATKSVYVTKLNELKVIGGPITDRAREQEALPHAVEVVRSTIAEYTALAQSTAEQYAHIEVSDRARVLAECSSKQQWLDAKLAEQAKRPLHQAPLITAAQLIDEKNKLIAACFPILNKPKPKPKPQEKPADDKASESPAAAEQEELLLTDEEMEL